LTTASAQAGPDEPRGVARLLLDPHFGGLFWGKFLTFSGVLVHALVTSVLAYEATGSSVAVALVGAALFAPQLFLAPWSGAVADRGHAVQQLVVGRLLCAGGGLALAAWVAWGEVRGGWSDVAVIAAATTGVGIGLAVGGPALNSVVPRMVSQAELPLAMSLNMVPVSVGRILGPAIGAWVLIAWGPVYALGVGAVANLVFALVVRIIHIPPGPRRSSSKENGVIAACRYVLGDRPLLLLLVAVTALGFGSEPMLTLAPSYADSFGGGSGLVGLLTSAGGVGSAVGLFLSVFLNGRVSQARVAASGLGTIVTALCACAVAPRVEAALAAFIAIGVGFTIGMASLSTLVQQRVPDELRGRVMALWMVGLVGARPLTALYVGMWADLAGVRAAFAATAAVMGIAVWACRPSRLT
jgi:MFS family permease